MVFILNRRISQLKLQLIQGLVDLFYTTNYYITTSFHLLNYNFCRKGDTIYMKIQNSSKLKLLSRGRPGIGHIGVSSDSSTFTTCMTSVSYNYPLICSNQHRKSQPFKKT